MSEDEKNPSRNMVGIKDLGKVRDHGEKVTLWHPTGKFSVNVDPLSANDLRQHQGFTNRDPKEVLKEAQAMVDGAGDGPSEDELAAEKHEAMAKQVAKEDAQKKADKEVADLKEKAAREAAEEAKFDRMVAEEEASEKQNEKAKAEKLK